MDTPRTVPLTVAQLLLGEDLPADAGRQVGERVEVDLDVVAATLGPTSCGALIGYFAACRALWTQREGDTPVVRTVRTLHADRKHERTGSRHYLTAELDAFETDATLAALKTALLTTSDPQLEEASALADAHGGMLVTETSARGARMVAVTCDIVATVTTPLALGGPIGPGEIRRTVTFEVNYARSNERASRRLSAVQVQAEELFFDPRPWRQLREAAADAA